jgi:hypothetical protein
MKYNILIIGGAPAGLSGALLLGNPLSFADLVMNKNIGRQGDNPLSSHSKCIKRVNRAASSGAALF